MKKRPLGVAVLIIVIALWILPAEMWMKDFPLAGGSSGEGKKHLPEYLTGQVWRLESRENGQTVYLKNSNLTDAGMILVYLNAGQDLAVGNTLLIKQPYKVQEPEKPGNPGQFDAYLYYRTLGVRLFCYGDEAEVVDGRR